MKKLLSLFLAVTVMLSCMLALCVPASAEVSGERVQDFSSLATAADVKTGLTKLDPLYWNVVETGGTYEVADRGDANGTALKWTTTTAADNACWSFASIPVSNNLAAADPVGTEAWLSLDFKMDGTGVSRQISLYNWGTSNWATAAFFTVPQNSAVATYKFNNAAANGNQTKTVVGNGWHTLQICVTKTGDATSHAKFLLDGQCMHEADVAALLPFDKVLLRQGGDTGFTPGTGSMMLDNMKVWKDTNPAKQPKVVFKLDTAAEWGTAPNGTTITDVPGSYGKAATDTVVRMEPATVGSVNIAQKTVTLPKQLAATDSEDILIDFDMRTEDYNWTRYLLFYKNGTSATAIQVKDGKAAYYSWHNNPATGRVIMPIDQWNHYTIRIKSDNTYQLYVNGVLENGHACAAGNLTAIMWYSKYEANKAGAGSYPGFADEMDNYTISLCPKEISDAVCTAKTRVYRNFDFDKTVAGGGYKVMSGTGVAVDASSGFFNNGNLNTTDNIVNGKAGKASTDKAMKYSATTAAVYTTYYYNNLAYSPENLVPGSTVRGGVSALYDHNGMSGRDTIFQLKLNPSVYTTANATVQAQPSVGVKPDGTVYYKGNPDQDIVETDYVVAANKWYRVEYVLNVGDATTGKAGTVQFYLDGKLLNEEPIDVIYWYVSAGTQDQTSPVGKCAWEVEDQDDVGCVYLDDFTVEYIPEGLANNDDIAKTVTLASNANKAFMSKAGVISLMDEADSKITVNTLSAALNAGIQMIDAGGLAVDGSALAAGTYAKLNRGVWPAIYTMASDLNVTMENETISAYMPYSEDTDTALIVATYDSGDTLVDVAIDTSVDGILDVTLSGTDAYYYKAFLWKGLDVLNPHYNSVSGDIY